MKHYRIALWTTGSATYADCIAGQIFKGFKAPLFIWSREKCIIRQDEETGKLAYLKDLKKIKGFKIPLENVLIVEDTPQAVQRHMGNLIKISKYYGLSEDAELIALAKYLISIKDVANFRELDKRGWRSSVTP